MNTNDIFGCGSKRKKRRETELQEITRLLHKTHKEVHEILAIVSKNKGDDFTKEDAILKEIKENITNAEKRIPTPGR